jgi:hypothetical protein
MVDCVKDRSPGVLAKEADVRSPDEINVLQP